MTTHVRVLTPVTSTQIRSDADIEALQGPDLIVSHDLNDIGPPSIESRFDEAFAIPGLLTKGMAAEREGVDAIVIDCMADPGLNALREAVNIPVLGPLETCVHLAAMMGTQFSIITVLESVRPMFEDLVRSYGVADRLASIRVITVPVLELFGDEERVQALLIREAKLAVEEDGASVLILGCTGFYGCADAMSAALEAGGNQIPVLDPIPVTVQFAAAMARAGVSHSKRTYARPSPKEMPGFNLPKD
jgi:allantoin racemase